MTTQEVEPFRSPLGSARRTIAANTTAQLVGKIITTGSSLIATILMARIIGPAFYGDFTKAFVTSTMFFVGIDFGINAIVVRRIANRRDREQPEFRNALGARLLLVLAAMMLLGAFLVVIPTTPDQGYSRAVKVATIIFSLTFIEHAIFKTANIIFQARLEYSKSAQASAVGSLVIVVGVLLVIVRKESVAAVALAYVAGSTVMSIMALRFIKKRIAVVLPLFDRGRLSALLKEASPIGATLILNLATIRMSTILLALLRPTSEVGYYGLATRVFDVILVFPTFFMNATYPIMVERWQQGPRQLLEIVKKAAKVLIATSLLSTVVLVVTSPWLALIREEFVKTRAPLLLLSFSLPLFFTSSLMQWTIVTMRRERALIAVYAVALAASIGLNIVTIPRYGMLATAATTGITEAFVLILTTIVVLQSFRKRREEAT